MYITPTMTPTMNAAYAAARAAYSARRIAAIADHEMAKKAYESKDENERTKP